LAVFLGTGVSRVMKLPEWEDINLYDELNKNEKDSFIVTTDITKNLMLQLDQMKEIENQATRYFLKSDISDIEIDEGDLTNLLSTLRILMSELYEIPLDIQEKNEKIKELKKLENRKIRKLGNSDS